MADPYNIHPRGKKGILWCDFILYGERVHRSTKCVAKPDATERCEGWAQEIRDRKDGKVKVAPAPTLKEALVTWEKAQEDITTAKHREVTAAKLRLHLADHMETPLDQLDTAKLRAIRAHYLKTPGPTGRTHTKGGANSLIKSVRTVLGFFLEDGTLATLPFKLRRIHVKRTPRRVVPIQDTQAFLAAVEAPYKGSEKKHSPKAKPKNPDVIMAIKLMLGLGLREHEALCSRAEWIDRQNRTYHAGETKNGEVRLIPIPNWLLRDLEAHLGDRKTGLIIKRPPPKKPRAGERIERPHAGQFTRRVLDLVGAELGIPGLTPHRLRATFATNHARAGTDVRKIQVWLDHAHIETTMLYIEMVEEGGHQAQARVEELMGLGAAPKIHPIIKKIVRKFSKKITSETTLSPSKP